MAQVTRTLRFRLTALHVLVFGVIQAVLCGTALFVYQAHLRSRLDETLSERARGMVEIVDAAVEEHGERLTPDVLRRYLDGFQLPHFYYEIRTEDGRLTVRSSNLDEISFPAEAGMLGFAGGPPGMHETLRGRWIESFLDTGELRALTLRRRPDSGEAFRLRLAVDPSPLRGEVRELRHTLVLASLLSMLAVATASWILARRSLAPIQNLGRQAAEVSPSMLDQRFEVPAQHDEVSDMVDTVNQMLGRLEDAFAAQGRFIANVSHEFKTPLTILLGQAQVLRRENRSPEEYDQFVASVEDEMRRLKETVDSFLMLARANAGLRQPVAARVSANDFVMEALERCQPLARHREIRLMPSLALLDDAADPVIVGDPDLLRTMVENLVRNAIRHAPLESNVEIDVKRADGGVRIAVADRGPGIPPDQLEQVFEEFHRGPVEERDSAGVGLGLAIAQAVARLHHGSIRATNREGGGAEFVILLPLTDG